MKNYWNSRTFWSALSAVVTGIGGVVAIWTADPKWGMSFVALAAGLAGMGNIFAREGGVTAALELTNTIPQTPETKAIVLVEQAKAADEAAVVLGP